MSLQKPPRSLSYATPARILGLALAYFITGKLALLLAIPPGYATAVWPGAGIALAALLLFGCRVWPGIFIGSFLINITTSLDATSTITIIASLPLPVAIATGAVLQALLGMFLVRRFIGFPLSFNHLHDILKVLLVSGPTSCLVNATVGVASLLLAGVLPWNNAMPSWWTWWLGDTLGVLIVIPLVLAWGMELRQTRLQSRITAALPICIAAALTLFIFLGVRTHAWGEKQLIFEGRVDHLAQSIMSQRTAYGDVLFSLQGLFHSSEKVERQEFHRFVAYTFQRHKSIHAVEWVPRVPDALRTFYEENARNEGYPDFQFLEKNKQGQMVQAKQRSEYFPVYYLEPYEGNEKALGFDMASSPDRLAAMNQARDTGKPVATKRINLVQDSDHQFGVLVFLPVYDVKLLQDTVEDRRKNLEGYALGVFRFNEMVEAAIAPFDHEGIELRIFDEFAPPDERLLYTNAATSFEESNPSKKNQTKEKLSGFDWQTTIDIAGRKWTLHFSPSAEYLAAQHLWEAWAVLTGGLIFTSLLGIFLLVLVGRKTMTELAVEERTAALKESEEKYSDLFENANDLIQSVASDGRFIYVNRAWLKTLGYEREDLSALTVFDIIAPENRDHCMEIFQNILSGIVVNDIEVVFQTKDGKQITVEGSVNCKFENGKPISTRAIFRDISERKMIEEALQKAHAELEKRVEERTAELKSAMEKTRESEAKFRGLVHSAPDGIIIVDTHGRITLVNDQAEKIYGYNKEELHGQPHDILLPKRLRKAHGSHRADYFAKPRRRPMGLDTNLVGCRKDGSEFPIELSLSPLMTTEGMQVISVMRDITERKQIEQELEKHRNHLEELVSERTREVEEKSRELEKATRLKSEFLANMSHELRTPMNSIIGFTGRVIKKGGDLVPEKQLTNLHIVLRNAHHLLSLINNLLDISKIESGKMEILPEEFNLADPVIEVVGLLETQANDKGITLRTELPEEPITLFTDKTKLRQILINLLGNAIKFTDQGSVAISARMLNLEETADAAFVKPGKEYVALSVTDSGQGMTEDEMGQIFKAFAQVGEAATRKEGGTGLGLAIAKNFSELLQGGISVESVKGEGATFIVTLPTRLKKKTDQASQPYQEGQETDGESHTGPTILCIDDNPEVLNLLRDYLGDEGYKVIGVTDPDQGIQKARELLPFAITLDIRMPGKDGWAVLEELKNHEATKDIPVIIITISDDGPAGLRLGAFDYVNKPIDPKALTVTLNKIRQRTMENSLDPSN